jgi:hypothetical protein
VDRQQKIEQIKGRDRVSKVSNLEVDPKYIHPDYESEPCLGVETETGNLEVLKVVPKSGNRPYFVARWDQDTYELHVVAQANANMIADAEVIRAGKKVD